jgi:signal transduction histidine kinase
MELPLRAVTGRAAALYSARSRNEHTDMIVTVILVLAQIALIMSLVDQRAKRRRADATVRRLVDTLDSERHHLARELHDNLSQKLALLCIEISRLRTRASLTPAMSEPVGHLAERAKEIAADVRDLSHGLYPPALALFGLAAALERLCEDVSRQCGIRIDFLPGGSARQLSRDAVLALFRITQEALQNIAKHSGAQHATVSLDEVGGKVRLHVADAGHGFDKGANKRGLGLLSMSERALLAGGRLVIRTAAGRGTHIVVTIKLNRAPLPERVVGRAWSTSPTQ